MCEKCWLTHVKEGGGRGGKKKEIVLLLVIRKRISFGVDACCKVRDSSSRVVDEALTQFAADVINGKAQRSRRRKGKYSRQTG
jgi:hypothetical protein